MDLNNLRRLAGITQESHRLMEAAKSRYLQMIQGVMPLLSPEAIAMFQKHLEWAQSELKRNDRIVWYLRWIRIIAIGESAFTQKRPAGNPLDQRLEDMFKKERQTLAQKSGLGEGAFDHQLQDMESFRFQGYIAHYLSLNLPGIERIQFAYQSPSQILADMNAVEKEWQEQMENEDRSLGPTDEEYDATQIMSFPNGFAWWNLGVGYCPREGDSMGHCGNGQHRDGTILSLRQRITKGGTSRDVPFLTFILDDDGRLGEMKGRNNQKPAVRYHPYIIALLKNTNVIKGIKGGGYAPERNFRISDLSEQEQKEVYEANPRLLPLHVRFQKEGLTKEFLNDLRETARVKEIPFEDIDLENQNVVLESFATLGKYIRNYHTSEKLDDALSFYNNTDLDDPAQFDLDSDYLYYVVSALPDPYQKKVAEELGIKATDRIKMVRGIVDRLQHRDLYDQVEQAMNNFISREHDLMNRSKENFIRYLEMLVGWLPFEAEYVWLTVQWNHDEPFDSPAQLETDLRSFVDYVDETGEEDAYDYNYNHLQNGWVTLRDYYDDSYDNVGDPELFDQWKEIISNGLKSKNAEWSEKSFDPKDIAMEWVKIMDHSNPDDPETGRFIESLRRRAGILK